jgi:hypothetical protein
MPTLETTDILLIALVEVLSLALIGNLWLKRRKVGVPAKCFWTVILLVPALGPIFYGLSASTPSSHGQDPGDTTGGWSPPGMEP